MAEIENQARGSFDNENSYDKVNRLLIKCIDFQKNLTCRDIKKLKTEDLCIKKLQDKYHALCQLPPEPFISVDLYIEKTSQSCTEPVKFKCRSAWSIRTVKHEVLKHFNLKESLENLLVLCRGHIAKDWQSLKGCGIKCNGDFIYVYVVEEKEEDPCVNEDSDSSKEIDEIMRKLEFPEAKCNITTDVFFIPTNNQTNVGISNYTGNQIPVQEFKPQFDKEEVLNKFVNSTMNKKLDGKNSSNAGITFDLDENSKTLEKQFLQRKIGWECPSCTYINEPTRPGCEICSYSRPENYIAPKHHIPSSSESERLKLEKQNEAMTIKMQEEAKEVAEEQRKKNYQDYLSAHEQNLLENNEPIDCSICLTEADIGEAVKLAECLHVFCKDCLAMHIMLSDQLPVTCPFVDDSYNCSSQILDREIRGLLSPEKFQAYLRKSLGAAECYIKNSFHCKSPDCYGWCEYDDGVNEFECPVCKHVNCMTCKAIHESQTCKEYQEKLFAQSPSNKKAKKTKKLLKKLLKKKDAMHCPNCNIIILKKEGCDWLRCTMCSLEICWVTQKPRWGPGGTGDSSGGCHCMENGVKCHPLCINCH